MRCIIPQQPQETCVHRLPRHDILLISTNGKVGSQLVLTLHCLLTTTTVSVTEQGLSKLRLNYKFIVISGVKKSRRKKFYRFYSFMPMFTKFTSKGVPCTLAGREITVSLINFLGNAIDHSFGVTSFITFVVDSFDAHSNILVSECQVTQAISFFALFSQVIC